MRYAATEKLLGDARMAAAFLSAAELAAGIGGGRTFAAAATAAGAAGAGGGGTELADMKPSRSNQIECDECDRLPTAVRRAKLSTVNNKKQIFTTRKARKIEKASQVVTMTMTTTAILAVWLGVPFFHASRHYYQHPGCYYPKPLQLV